MKKALTYVALCILGSALFIALDILAYKLVFSFFPDFAYFFWDVASYFIAPHLN